MSVQSQDKSEIIDLSSIESLLEKAKSNLLKSCNERSPDNEDESELAKIRRQWKSLPEISDPLNFNEQQSQSKKNSPVKLTTPEQSSSSTVSFRKIEDPVLVAQSQKQEKESHAGADWFNMPKTEMNPSIKRDLQLLQMRSVLDPKRHYKKDRGPLPTYFQAGTIVEGNTEFFSARLSRKDRKTTIADEILADEKSKKYFKRKYGEIQVAKTSGGKAYYKKLKAMRKKL